MIEDAELLRRYVEDKSEQAFAELVQRHLGLVYGCALRRVGGDPQLAEDVAQQVFTEVARRATVLAGRPVLAGWLFTSARFAAAKAMRTARRRLNREREAHLMQELSRETTAQFDWEKSRPVLDDAIAGLNEKDRESILLRFFEARDFPSMGAKLNLSENAARMRVERALEKLRARLKHRGVTSSAAVIATVLSQQAAIGMPVGLAAHVTSAALTGGAIATGAVAAGGASTAIVFMSVTKLQIGIAGALIAAATTGFVINAQSNERLRRETAALQQQNQEINSQWKENIQLKNTAAEVAALRQDDAALARLRDEAATLQERLQKSAVTKPSLPVDATTAPQLSESTIAVLHSTKSMIEAKNWSGVLALYDGLISQLEPTSYDMAYILDAKARTLAAQEQYSKAIEPWEKALQLSRQYNYFDEKQALDAAENLYQLKYAQDPAAKVPPRRWF